MSKKLLVTVSENIKKKIEDESKKKNISQSALVNIILSEKFEKESV